MNVYQVDTVLQIDVTFYDVASNIPADPTTVALFVEDPSGNVTEVPTGQITRSGVGAYSVMFLPPAVGQWKYKWQGTGSVAATSPDKRFFVQASDLISE